MTGEENYLGSPLRAVSGNSNSIPDPKNTAKLAENQIYQKSDLNSWFVCKNTPNLGPI
jgi:hypothetical protein